MFAWQFQMALGIAEKHGWTRFVSMQNHLNLIYREEEREMITTATPQRMHEERSRESSGPLLIAFSLQRIEAGI